MAEPGVIRRLEEAVVNRIAAGEVIQRPANALKELMENSLDAKSTNIMITVKSGGLKYLQIQDNGTGIRKDNLEIVCERFTTSKLKNFEDLQTIDTYGFRGEALASISHVAHLTIQTKTADEKCAFKGCYEDGKLKGALKPSAGNQGTQITVEDLFHNVLTRKRALKSPNEEYQKILEVVGSYAVHYCSVGFMLRKFGENADLRTPPSSNHIDNIRTIYGNTIARELMEVSASDATLRLKFNGFITNVNYSTKKGILLLFINNRLVESVALKKMLDSIYAVYLPKNGHSFAYISLELDPKNVDVNVHPTKHEVHFLHEEQIIDKIKLCVESKLLSCNTSRTLYMQTRLPGATVPDMSVFEDKNNPDKTVRPQNLVRTDSTVQKIDKFFGVTSTPIFTDKNEPVVVPESNDDDTITENHTKTIDIIKPVGVDLESSTIRQIIVPETSEDSTIADDRPKSPKMINTTTPGYVDPKSSFKDRCFVTKRIETKLTSVKMLRLAIEDKVNMNLREMFANLIFVGCINECKALIQHSTKLLLCDTEKIAEELFYQMLIYDFQNFNILKFSSPLPIAELARLGLDVPESGWTPEDGDKDELASQVKTLLMSKSAMLKEYYSFEIDNDGNLISIPVLLDNWTPFMGALPMYILQLATEVNWESEKECFQSFSRQTAIFYSKPNPLKDDNSVKTQYWQCEHILFPVVRKYFLPPREFATNGTILQIANLPDLYKVFERC